MRSGKSPSSPRIERVCFAATSPAPSSSGSCLADRPQSVARRRDVSYERDKASNSFHPLAGTAIREGLALTYRMRAGQRTAHGSLTARGEYHMAHDAATIEAALKAIRSDEHIAQRFAREPDKVLAEYDTTLKDYYEYFIQVTGQKPPARAPVAINVAPMGAVAAAAASPPIVRLSVRWWGISLHLSHDCLTAIQAGSVGATALAGLIGKALLSGGGWITAAAGASLGPIAAAIAAIVVAKL